MIKGKIPTLANLAMRKGKRESLVLASSWVVRKAIKVVTAAILMAAVIPKAAIVVTVVTVVIVVIIFLLYIIVLILLGKNTFVNRYLKTFSSISKNF